MYRRYFTPSLLKALVGDTHRCLSLKSDLRPYLLILSGLGKLLANLTTAILVAWLCVGLLVSAQGKENKLSTHHDAKMQVLADKAARLGLFNNDAGLRAVRNEMVRRGMIHLPRPAHSLRSITTAGIAKSLTTKQIAAIALPSVVRLTVRGADGIPSVLGSGFVVGENMIVTNNHVVKSAWSVNANFLDGRSESVLGVITTDDAHDLALLLVNTKGVKPLTLADNNHASIGDNVVAVGNPEGLDGSISTGVVSALRNDGASQLIQTNAAISPGSSGGPLLDDQAHVLGVTSFTLVDGQNLNFAYPASYIKQLVHAKPTKFIRLNQLTDKKALTLGECLTDTALGYIEDEYKPLISKFDSAKYVQTVFAEYGLNLPVRARDQAAVGYDVPHDIVAGDIANWVLGDRLYFALNHPEIDHTGIYIGSGQFIHISADNAFQGVAIDDIKSNYFASHLVAVRRSQELLGEPNAP